MAHRIEVAQKIEDMRAKVRQRGLNSSGTNVSNVQLVDVYTVEGMNDGQVERVREMLTNPVTQISTVNSPVIERGFDSAIEVGFLPGVTDNVGNTTREMARYAKVRAGIQVLS